MANPRPAPYIWATWLAHLMSGQFPCYWQYWFQTHHQLSRKQPSDFNHAAWTIDHVRMVEELRRKLKREVGVPKLAYHFKVEHVSGATIGGEVDCLSVNGNEAVVYDCKTGQQRTSDQVQVMIYMYALSRLPEFREKQFSGVVLYKDGPCEIPELPTSFTSNLDYFVQLLADKIPAVRVPGFSCQFCSITSEDCAERMG